MVYRAKGNDEGISVAISLDEKDVIVGGTLSGRPAVLGFTGNGSNGKSFDKITDSFGKVTSVALQPEGNKVVAAVVGQKYSQAGVFPIRFENNGTLDSQFKQLVTEGLIAEDTRARLLIQPDGKIVIGATLDKQGDKDIVLMRYAANGNEDMTFAATGDSDGFSLMKPPKTYQAANGAIGYDFANGYSGTEDILHGLSLQEDGKILIAGRLGSRYGIARIDGSTFTTVPSSLQGSTLNNVAARPVTISKFQRNSPIGHLSDGVMVPFMLTCVGINGNGVEEPYSGCKYSINSGPTNSGNLTTLNSWVKNKDRFVIQHTQGKYKTVKSTIVVGGVRAPNNNQLIMGQTRTATFITNAR